MIDRNDIGEVFRASQDAIDCLKQSVPEVNEVMADRIRLNLQMNDGWQKLCGMPRGFIEVDGKPVLIAVLVGPSGAGKSTIFKLLTGVDVPASDAVRPVTYNSTVAIPEQILTQERIKELFPDYGVFCHLDDIEQLKDDSVPSDHLFYTRNKTYDAGSHVWCCLGDVPDFNTIEKKNWEKADRMMARADLVIFVTYGDGYKDKTVVDILARCCRQAGALAYVFTKTLKSPAREKWKDITSYAMASDSFAAQRHDGQTLGHFLKTSRVFCSPQSASPDLADCCSIREESNDKLGSLLGGVDGAQILLSARLQAIKEGLASANMIQAKAERRRETLTAEVASAGASISKEADRIAHSAFPLGRMLELIIHTSKGMRPLWLQRMTLPLSKVAGLALRAGRVVRSRIAKLRKGGRPEEVVEREELERTRRSEASERLVDHWRSVYEDETSRLLVQSCCGEWRDKLAEQPLPAVGTDWEDFVVERTRLWALEHHLLAITVGTLNDLLVFLGGATIVVDFFVGGGLGSLGLATWLAGGSSLSGVLLKVVEEFKLRGLLLSADEKWRAQRTEEFDLHIRRELADPLFLNAWNSELGAIEASPLEKCSDACTILSKIVKEYGHD
jgi:ABC-type Fe3+/spermidine/putrescine transport system ATPase subunit